MSTVLKKNQKIYILLVTMYYGDPRWVTIVWCIYSVYIGHSKSIES